MAKAHTPPSDLIRMCNCAACGRELVSRLDAGTVPRDQHKTRLVAGRINDRPYCWYCLSNWQSNNHGTNARQTNRGQDNNPAGDNARRALEGD